MRQHHVLLLCAVGIMVIALGAYAFITQRVATTNYEDSTHPEYVSKEKQIEPPLVVTSEEDKIMENVMPTSTPEVVSDQPVATVPPTPTPTPTPKPIPIPTPGPTPNQAYTLAEVALHATKESCWTIIRDNVYDVTTYVTRHPGGEKNILKICGKDGSELFEGQHGGDSRPENTLATFRIGTFSK